MNLVFIFKLFGGMQLPMDAHARYPSRWGCHIENAFDGAFGCDNSSCPCLVAAMPLGSPVETVRVDLP
jgi:hypothetical protein